MKFVSQESNHEGIWVDETSGERLTFTDWKQHSQWYNHVKGRYFYFDQQPDDKGTGQDFALLDPRQEHLGTWNDVSPSSREVFIICEL